MLEGKRFYVFLAIFFVILLIPAYWLPLFETTDARYAEISREMLANHNFMVPFYNGIKHFHKPPFTYWMDAFGMYIFGINGLGARFFGAVASVLCLVFTRKTAFVLTGDRKVADNTVLILVSSVLFIIVSTIVSTDIYLELFTIAALYHMFKQIYGRKSMSNAVLTGVYLGLGFLTKGPVIFLFTLLPFVAAVFVDRAHRRAFSSIQWLVTFLAFAVIALPWYIYVVITEPGLLNYFLVVQTVDRVATNRFSRAKPFYYFFMVFFVTFLPWVFYFLRNYKFTNKIKPGKLLYLYVILPFIVFQISTSKLGTYILPFYPAAAVIAAVNLESRLLRRLAAAMLVLMGVTACVLPLFETYVKPYDYILIPFGVFYTLLALFLIFKGPFKKDFVKPFAWMVLLFALFAYSFIPVIGPYVKGYRILTNDIKKFDPSGHYSVLIYRAFLPSISFYLNDVKPIALSRPRETQFQQESDYKRYLIQTVPEMKEYLKTRKELIIVTRHDYYKAFEKESGYSCKDISVRGGEKRAMLCKSSETGN